MDGLYCGYDIIYAKRDFIIDQQIGRHLVVVVVVAIVNTQKSRLILVNMEIGRKDHLANR